MSHICVVSYHDTIKNGSTRIRHDKFNKLKFQIRTRHIKYYIDATQHDTTRYDTLLKLDNKWVDTTNPFRLVKPI